MGTGADDPRPQDATDARHPLVGARVKRVDAPAPDLLALTLTTPEAQGALLIGLARHRRGVGLVAERPRGAPASPFVRKLRAALSGGRVTAIEGTASGLCVEVLSRGQRYFLHAHAQGQRGNARLTDAQGETLARLHPDAEGGAVELEVARDLPSLRRAGDELLRRWRTAHLEAIRDPLARSLAAASKRLRRRLLAIEADRARVAEVATLRAHASLVLAHLHQLSPRAQFAELDDTMCEPPAKLRLEFARGLGPREQAERWFERARKLERGARIAEERAALTQTALAQLDALAAEVAAATDTATLEQLRERAQRAGVEGQEPGVPRSSSGKRLPYRRFDGHGGRAILVGRGAADNDRLTLHHARPQDLWLHSRETGGAHVVVPLERGEACPPDLLVDAATLAAHFSRSRGDPQADVSYVERRYVRKPRKAPVGTVVLEREKVLHLRLEPDRLARLLSSERGRHGA